MGDPHSKTCTHTDGPAFDVGVSVSGRSTDFMLGHFVNIFLIITQHYIDAGGEKGERTIFKSWVFLPTEFLPHNQREDTSPSSSWLCSPSTISSQDPLIFPVLMSMSTSIKSHRSRALYWHSHNYIFIHLINILACARYSAPNLFLTIYQWFEISPLEI